MAFLSQSELAAIGFKSLGKNVKISDKAAIYNADQIEIGDNSRIDDFCVISGKIKIGKNIHITVFCNLAGGSEGIVLEDFSTLAYGCHVFTQSDDYGGLALTNSTIPAQYKNEKKLAVKICRHSIIGAKSVIVTGVTLSEGTSVGAMSLVTKTTEEWSIYFGIPAKKIKDRKRELLKLEIKYLSENS